LKCKRFLLAMNLRPILTNNDFYKMNIKSLFKRILWVIIACASPLLANALPDFLVSYSNVVGASGSPGSLISVSYLIGNNGNGTNQPFALRFYLSNDSVLDNDNDDTDAIGDLIISTINYSGLSAGGLSSVTQPMYLPLCPNFSYQGDGTYYVLLKVDADDQVAENNENNNYGTDTITINILDPDLVGYDGRGSSNSVLQTIFFDAKGDNLAWSDKIDVKYGVWNNSGQCAGEFLIKFYLSADTTFGEANDYLIASADYTSGLPGLGIGPSNVGDYEEIGLPLTNPLAGSPTTVYVGMVIDVDGEVTEVNEDNNKNYLPFLDYDSTPLTIVDPVPDIHPSDSSIDFGLIKDDGPGQSSSTRTLTLTNNGKANLSVSSISLTSSSDFRIENIVSSIQDMIPPSTLPKVMLPRNYENWIITLVYDPDSVGAASGNLIILSDDLDESPLNISLTGTGEAVADIAVVDSSTPANDYNVKFGGVMNDGAGGSTATHTVTLSNPGSGVLTIAQNGISLSSGTHFSLNSVTSDTQGAINLATGSAPIAIDGGENWTIPLEFDPTAIGQHDSGLEITSDDPDEPSVVVSLSGIGLTPMDIEVSEDSGTSNDFILNFGNVHADGSGLLTEEIAFTIANTGETPLEIAINGITLSNSTHYQIVSIVSDIEGNIDLSAGPINMASESSETWTITVAYDPTIQGTHNESITVQSNDPDENPVIITLNGTGLFEPDIEISDSAAPANDLILDFGVVLNDGDGGSAPPPSDPFGTGAPPPPPPQIVNRISSQTVTLTNFGADNLIVNQNGITITSGVDMSILSIESSIDGAVDLASADPLVRTISAAQAEIWTVTLEYNPHSNGIVSGSLQVSSNDPDEASAQVSLAGEGEQPSISLLKPESGLTLNLQAGSAYDIVWADDYEAGNATITLYLSNDTDPSSSKLFIASGLFEDNETDSFSWQPEVLQQGGPYYLYATISDASVTTNSFSAGQVIIDPSSTFQLLSPIKTTSGDYAYEYTYKGQTYSGVTQLTDGDNTVTVTTPLPSGNVATHSFTVSKVTSLLHSDGYTYDDLNRVETFTNGNGITTTYYYDDLGRLDKTVADNGNTVDYDYDVLGRMRVMTDSTGTTFYDFDDLDRLTYIYYSKNSTKGDSDDHVLEYQYYLNNLLKYIIYPNGETIHYTYDSAGRLKTVDNQTLVLVTTYYYHAATGQLHYFERPNGIRTVYGYDNVDRVDLVRHEKIDANPIGSGELVLEFDYDISNLGFADWLTTNRPGSLTQKEHYIYDNLDRINIVIYSDDGILDPLNLDANDRKVTYNYDKVGNRKTLVEELNGQELKNHTYFYGNENRLLRIADSSGNSVAEFVYDSAGNRKQKISPGGTTAYDYDERNLLVEISRNNTLTVYRYNGAGHRIEQTRNGLRNYYLVDPNWSHFRDIAEYDDSGIFHMTSTHGHERLFTHSYDTSNTQFYLYDRLGSLRAVLDDLGNVIKTIDYDAYGTIRQ